MPPLDRRPRCKSELATFGRAGWIAASPAAGQGRVSTPSACEPLSSGRPLLAQEGRLSGQAAPGHCLGCPSTVGYGANLSRPPSGKPAGSRLAPLLGRAAYPCRRRERRLRAGARRRRERAPSLVRRPQETVCAASGQAAPVQI